MHGIYPYENLYALARWQVFKAKDLLSGEVIALKRIFVRQRQRGIHSDEFREVEALQSLQNKNVVRLLDVCRKVNNTQLKISTNHDLIEPPIYLVQLPGPTQQAYCDHNARKVSWILPERRLRTWYMLQGSYLILVMEFCATDLRCILAKLKGVPPPEKTQLIMKQILKGLKACHDRGAHNTLLVC